MKRYFVYILTNKRNGTLYIGVTNDIMRRTKEHKDHINSGFTKRYNVTRLVYFEMHSSILEAIKREKQMKKWKRQWKIELIENKNPEWKDLYDALVNPSRIPLSRD